MQNTQIVVLGASNKAHRYSYKAIKMLLEYGHHVLPVHPKIENIEGLVVKHHLSQILSPVDTLTLYIGPKRISPLIDDIVKLNPSRVILNPGTESDELELALLHHEIPFVKDCTLLMLEHGRF
ncbi:MAG: CoA-binding protein [endosymbiont of Galathealinum brachiosum]|uniref:CoA-binding protein n=1 Tax=endosymbiont of Galathealinum brachiosum TaxID=2200906 RepID=A0A370DI38_9GAMM|nr:MAG: CoA-binding protein [endosymbiont of Galathealinum brachiosum]